MEVAQNYENSAQFLQKSLKRSERKGVKYYRKERRWKKHSEFDNSSANSESDTATSNSESLESDPGTRTRNLNQGCNKSKTGKTRALQKSR